MGKTLLLSVLLIDKTLLVCLSMTIALITGINGQCSTSDIKPLVLDASTNDEKNIYSPNYPDGYPEMSDCEWRIQAPFGYVVLLCMSFIGLDATLECNVNNIGVFDGNSTDNRQLLDKFCSLQQKQLYSSSSEMLVKFTSDDSKSFMGFHFLFKAVLKSDITVSPNCTKASTFNPVQGNDSTSTAVVLGSFIAAIFLLIIFFVTFRYCLRKRSTRGSSSHPPASASNRTPTNTSTLRSCTLLPNSASSATLYPNNNTIFMIAPSSQSLGSTHPHNSSSGVTNLAYSSFGDRPPSYSSIQQETGQIVQSLTFVLSSAYDPPPSYSETMMKSHPPAVPLLKTTLMSPPSATINSETFRIPQPGEVPNSEDSPNSPSVLPCFPSSVYSEALRLSRPGERPYSVDRLYSEDISLSPLTPDLESVIAQTQSTNAECLLSLSVGTQNSESVVFDNHSPASTNSESVTSDSLGNNLNSLLLRSQTHSPTTVNSESVTHPLADRCSEA